MCDRVGIVVALATGANAAIISLSGGTAGTIHVVLNLTTLFRRCFPDQISADITVRRSR